MGNKPTHAGEFHYSDEVDSHQPNGYGKPHRHHQFKGALMPTYKHADGTAVTTLYENFQLGLRLNPQGNCVGTRPITDGTAGDYHWENYSYLWKRIKSLGAALHHANLAPQLTFEGYPPMRLVGLYSKNRPEWVITEQAGNAYGLVVVPLYDTLGAESLQYILNQCELQTIVCATKTEVNKVLDVQPKCPHLKNIIIMDSKSKVDWKADRGLTLHDFAELYAIGDANPREPTPPKPEDVATFCYTSGTTGDPKGAMLTHGNIIACVAGVQHTGVHMTANDVHLSYLPLPHMFERIVQTALWQGGAAIGFYQGDTLKIVDDIKALRPTIFPSVPRMFNRMYEKITTTMDETKGFKGKIIHHAKIRKTQKLIGSGEVKSALWDKLVFDKLQSTTGLQRCRVMLTGSAPIARHVMEFLRVSFSNPVCEGYGSTETAAACTLTALQDQATVGHVGGPLPCNEVCLVDVEDMAYLSTDTEHKGEKVRGRGEICVRGPNVFRGYFRNPEKTQEAIDEHGWLHSGDIGVWLPNGALRIVDRKKNIFKLAQGEYVASEKIENVLTKSPFVEMIFVYGDSLHSFLVAVVVPDIDAIKRWGTEHHKNIHNRGDVVNDDTFKKMLLDEIKTLGKKEGLLGFEVPKAVHLTADPFSVENDLLTPTFKLKRNQAQAAYQKQIDTMYESEAIGGKTGLKQGEH